MTDQPQNMRALTYGNTVRLLRGHAHQEIRALPQPEARERVAGILDAGEKEWRTMKVYDLLRWPRFTQQATVQHWLREAGISSGQMEWRMVGELSPRQRRVLAASLRDTVSWPVDRRAA
jgi:hypothetical protein